LNSLHQFMNHRKLPPLILAVFLQFAPVVKLFQTNPMLAGSSPLAIVLRWAAGVAAAVGAYHTVTGASAAIAGMAKYTNSPTGLKLAGPVTTNAVAAAGQEFIYRIVVTNPGTDHAQDLWDVRPLPPGLTINNQLGGTGFITNAPGQVTVAGVYPVTLVAGNTNCSCVVTMPATITITGGSGSAPVITNQPANATVLAGTNASFTVGASGSPTPSYQWRKGTTNISWGTTATLTITNAQAADAGAYSVTVMNTSGTNVSNPATLTVVSPPLLSVSDPSGGLLTLSFTTEPTASYALEYAGTIPTTAWNTLTNFPASAVSSNRSVVDSTTNATRFYRLNMSLP
jgi:uncharacterized repeat protein (TIGR01451 family)